MSERVLTWLSVAAGVAVILAAARDIFLTVLTSTGRGPISRWLMNAVWRGMGPVVRRWSRWREVIGPLIFIGVFGVWSTMIVTGWALIYWPFLPDEFLVDFGVDLQRDSPGNFVTALYLSMVVLVTLGFGDIVPTDPWLRLFVPFEGLLGFALITAAISWFLSIAPAMSRRRRLAHQIELVREAGEFVEVGWGAESTALLLDSFARQLIDIRSDQVQFPIIYYFRDADPRAELVLNLDYLIDLAEWARVEYEEAGGAVDLHQRMLRRALDDYVLTAVTQFVDPSIDDPKRALEVLVADHR
jgi:hypothetical protein